MSLTILKLALKSLRFRKFTVALTVFSLAISMMLFLTVDNIRGQAKNSFVNTVSDIDLIVGARSGSIQLLLYSIFHIGNATNNISWNTYQKISSHPRIAWSIPLSLGDSHKGFRVIGTEKHFFQNYSYHKNTKLAFAKGSEFSSPFDVVIGANVAKKLSYTLNEDIIIAHGIGNVGLTRHEDTPFKIKGILKPTGSPIDDSLLISLQGLELMHTGWESGVNTGQRFDHKTDSQQSNTIEPKSITAFLLKLKSKHDVFGIQRAINQYNKEPLLAILPSITLLELWKVVGIIEKILLVISSFVIITALLSMLAIILTNLNSRRHEIAVLRSLGASPFKISLLMILETELLILIATVFAMILMYTGIIIAGPFIHASTGINLELTPPTDFQWILIACVLIAGLIVSLIPAYNVYRKTLQDGLTIRS